MLKKSNVNYFEIEGVRQSCRLDAQAPLPGSLDRHIGHTHVVHLTDGEVYLLTQAEDR